MTIMTLWALAALLVVAGFIGTLLPIVPGPVLVFAGLLLGAWIDGFERVGWVPLILLGLFALGTFIIDLAAPSLGTRSTKASRWAMVGAGIGAVVGLFFGFLGVFIAPFVGAVAGEYWAARDLRRAGRVGAWAWLGMLLGSVMKLAVVFAMVGVFVVAFLI